MRTGSAGLSERAGGRREVVVREPERGDDVFLPELLARVAVALWLLVVEILRPGAAFRAGEDVRVAI